MAKDTVSTNAKGPLAGIRILEIAAYISGPYGGSILQALGAEVVKIEPLKGEAFRIGMNNRSPYFVQYNAGKKSVAIDLKNPKGLAVIRAMVPKFDALIENMRPGKLAALGLGVEDCRELNDNLVYLSMSGFGSGGPLADRPAYDSIGQAFGGLYTFMNDPGNVRLTGTCMADLISGSMTAMGVLAALVGRERDPARRGVQVETSVFEAMSALTIDALTQALDKNMDPVRETRHPQAQNFCLETRTGDFIVLHLSSSQKFWEELARIVDRPDLIDDPRFRTYADRVKPENFEAIKQVMIERFATRSRAEWEQLLTEADVPFAPALTMTAIAEHPQTEWLDMFGKDHAGQALVRPPWRLDGCRPAREGDAPLIGEHTREVLSEFFDASEVDALAASGVIFAPDLA